jgi:hypothetical protein
LTKLLHEFDLTKLCKTNANILPMGFQPVMLALEASAFSMVQEQEILYLVEQSSKPDKLTLRHWKSGEDPSDGRTVACNAMESTPVAYLVRRTEGQNYVGAPNHKD